MEERIMHFDRLYNFYRFSNKEAVKRLSAYADTVDPNWSEGLVSFPEPLIHPPFSFCRDDQAKENAELRKRPQFRSRDLSPERAVVNGPERGDVDFRDKILEILSEPLLAILRVIGDYEHNAKFLHFYNRNHRVQLINGRTVVGFENCDVGVVQNFNPQSGTFEVLVNDNAFGGLPAELRQVRHYTVAQLHEELAMDDFRYQACRITYLPPT